VKAVKSFITKEKFSTRHLTKKYLSNNLIVNFFARNFQNHCPNSFRKEEDWKKNHCIISMIKNIFVHVDKKAGNMNVGTKYEYVEVQRYRFQINYLLLLLSISENWIEFMLPLMCNISPRTLFLYSLNTD